MTGMDELVTWLRAQLDDEERAAFVCSKVLTAAAAEALKVADNYRSIAQGAAGEERAFFHAKAAGADAVMVHLIRLAHTSTDT